MWFRLWIENTRIETFVSLVLGGKLNAAVRENDFVYHDKVLSADSLPEVKGAVLVKGTPFDPNDPEASRARKSHDLELEAS